MAGIGFELQRVLKKGGIGSFFKVALSGVIIVAGPWILSIIGIFLIGRFSGTVLAESRGMFMGVVIYSYAFSLFIFGGSHYVFTRLISDLIYKDQDRESGAAMLQFAVLVGVLAAAIATAAVLRFDMTGISHPGMFRIAAIGFFVVINIIWLQMIFISLLKQYMAIFLIFTGGMGLSLLGVILLGSQYALGGAMLGFSSGQALIVILLFVLSFKDFRPGNGREAWKQLWAYFPRYRYLLLTGLFYYWGIWIDKMVFWFTVGQPVSGTFFRLFDLYDIPVYLANLTMIPGLIYFVIVCETDFYIQLKDFLQSMADGMYRMIERKREQLGVQMRRGIREQTLFQGVLTVVFILLVPAVSSTLFAGTLEPLVMRITLAAVFFQLLFVTLMTFLFYFEMYPHSFIAALSFFTVNAAGSILLRIFGAEIVDRDLYGASYLIAGIVASFVAGGFLFSAIKKVERRIYARYT